MSRAFTLVELLVSIAIFVVAATLMFGALFGATEVFRRGEAARQAGDEATAVIAALQEDLSRAVPFKLRDGEPAREWGRLWARPTPTGDCVLGLVIENPDRAQVRWIDRPGTPPTRALVGIRQWVVWQVVSTSGDPAESALQREVWDITEDGTVVDASGNQMSALSSAGRTPRRRDVISRGCLHFGIWLEIAEAHRVVKAGAIGPDIRWESDDPAEAVAPFRGHDFDTRVLVGGLSLPFYPQPDAVRISLVLTGGGRFTTRGTLVQDNGTEVRISGIKALPTITGSLLRVGDEWLRYDDFRSGRLTGVTRAQMRSDTQTHQRGATVFAGQVFSLVQALPR